MCGKTTTQVMTELFLLFTAKEQTNMAVPWSVKLKFKTIKSFDFCIL